MATATHTAGDRLTLDCIVCSSPYSFDVKRKGRYPRFCSDQCREQRKREQFRCYRVPAAHTRTCRRCGSTFVASKPSALYCSYACRAALKRRRRKDRGYQRPPQHTYWAIKRARKRAAVVESVDPFEVFERDGWRCHLCGRVTLKGKRGTTHDRAPELDHIIPLAEGGEHSYRNTACACRKCNMSKGATIKGQMLLFG